MQPTTKDHRKTGRPRAKLFGAQLATWHRWQQHPASTRPPARTMASIIGISRDTFALRMKEQGRGFTPIQLIIIRATLDNL